MGNTALNLNSNNGLDQRLYKHNEKVLESIRDSMSKKCYGVYEIVSDKQVHRYVHHKLVGTKNFVWFGKSESNLKKKVDPNHNWYISMNTFKHHHSTEQDLIGLTGLFFDLDTLKNGIHNFDYLNLMVSLKLMPTAVVFSGHGYYILYIFNKPINLYGRAIGNPLLYKWKHVENQIAQQIDKFSLKTYGKRVVDQLSLNPNKILRCSNSINVKYKDITNPYLMPVEAHVSMINPNYRYSLSQLAKVFAPSFKGNISSGYHRYIYVNKHKKYYQKLTKHIEYIKHINGLPSSNKYNKNNEKINYNIHSKGQFRLFNALKDRYSGFYEHIMNENYKVYGHVELAMFIEVCLISELSPVITTKAVFKNFNKFIDDILAPKLFNEGHKLSKHDKSIMYQKLRQEYTNFNNGTSDRFYRLSNKWIMDKMDFRGNKLYLTYKDRRKLTTKKNKKSKNKRNRRIRKYYKRVGIKLNYPINLRFQIELLVEF